MAYPQRLGKFGEKLAEKYFLKKGYKIISRNFHAKEGEIDLICQKDGFYIFVEVKTRTSFSFGLPEEAIDENKREKICLAIEKYLQKNNIVDANFRLDVVCIFLKENDIRIKHLVNI